MHWLEFPKLTKFPESMVLPFLQGQGGASNIKVGTNLKEWFNLRICKQVCGEGVIKYILH